MDTPRRRDAADATRPQSPLPVRSAVLAPSARSGNPSEPGDALAGLLRRAVSERGAPTGLPTAAGGDAAPTSPPGVIAPALTSPPSDIEPDAAVEDQAGVELTSPVDWVREAWAWGSQTFGGATPVAVQRPKSLKVKGTGTITGSHGISDYWPVRRYWGSDRTLGKFDRASAGGWRMLGHKFQVIGEFASGETTTGTGGPVTFLQEARLTNTKGDPPGPWFNDMDYIDAGGGAHQWDPNAESGTVGAGGYPGVRRTISTSKYAYTDPPAIGYRPGVTDSYRKLEFRITLKAPPGSWGSDIVKLATQEIEIVKGKPKVLQAP